MVLRKKLVQYMNQFNLNKDIPIKIKLEIIDSIF